MFDSPEYPDSLSESIVESWFELGRANAIPYAYLLIIWDDTEGKYLPIFAEKRSEFDQFEPYGESLANQTLVAAYDLYSENKVS